MKKGFKICLKFFLIIIIICLFSPYKIFASDILSTWEPATSLPYALGSGGAYTTNTSKIFLIGGATTTIVPANLYSTSNPSTGSLSSWESAVAIPPDILWHSLSKKDGFIYLIGGSTYLPSNSIDTTYIGKLLSDGSVASWNISTSLPKPLSIGASAVIGNKLYFSGGFNQGTGVQSNKVYVTTINPFDGSLSSWSEAGDLPFTISGHGMLAYNNSLYIIGGYDGTNDLKTVYKATPVNDHINTWIPEPSLPDVSYRSSYILKDKYIFVLGGATHTGTTSNQVYYSQIGNDGTLLPWTTSTYPLPKTVCCGSAEIVGDYIYQIGGYSVTDGYLNDVFVNKTATETILDIPILKQTDPIWKDSVYDTANVWSPSDTKFGSWGCGVTSAAMVFQYNHITRLPDNLELNPGSLNSWLKNQLDGYIGQGFVNWLALSRLSRLAKLSGNNPSFPADALEYSRISNNNKVALINNLSNNHPVILEEPGHFVVAKGISGDTFAINDPYYSRNLLTDGYNNTFLSQGVFTPSNTDLSYLMVTGDKNLSFTIHSSSSAATTSFLQQHIASETNINKKVGDPFSLLYFQKPDDDTYTLTITSSATGMYTIQIYTYDQRGNVKVFPITVVLISNIPKSIVLTYDKNNNSTKVVRTITFASTLADIKEGVAIKLINPALAPGLTQLIQTAEGLSKNKLTKTQAKQVLKTFEQTVKKWNGTPALSSKMTPILLEDAAALNNSF